MAAPPVISYEPSDTGRAGGVAQGARLSLILLLSINLFNYIDRYVLAAVEPQIAAHFFPGQERTKETLAKTGLLATAFLVTYLVAAPLFGWLADRMSRWLLVGLSVGVWSVATGASGLAGTFGLLLLMRCFVGIGEAGYGPAAPTLIADMYPVRRRGSVLAWFYMAIPVGSALGYVIGAFVVSAHGGDQAWRWAFYVVTPPGLILAIWCLLMRDPPRGRADALEGRVQKPGFRDYLTLFRNRSFVFACAGMTAMTFAIGGISFWMPRYLTEVKHGGENSKMIFGGIVVVAGIVATLLGGIVGDRLKPRYPGSYFLVSGVAMLVACPFLLLMLRPALPWAYVPLFLACFFLFFNTGPTNTILANVTHPSIRASAFALNIFVIHALGDAISPPILGTIAGGDEASASGWNAAFYVVAAVMALAGVLWLWGAKYLEADTLAVTGGAAPAEPAPPVVPLATEPPEGVPPPVG